MQKINVETVETVTHTIVLNNKKANNVGIDDHGDQKNCINKVSNKR